jgi:hypothetical protein
VQDLIWLMDLTGKIEDFQLSAFGQKGMRNRKINLMLRAPMTKPKRKTACDNKKVTRHRQPLKLVSIFSLHAKSFAWSSTCWFSRRGLGGGNRKVAAGARKAQEGTAMS